MWLVWLEPVPSLVPSLWHPEFVRVPRDAARELSASLVRMGAKVGFAADEEGAHAEADDLREICKCEGGRGRYRCSACQSESFIASASASLRKDH